MAKKEEAIGEVNCDRFLDDRTVFCLLGVLFFDNPGWGVEGFGGVW